VTYNLSVADHNTYFVGEHAAVVHNCNCVRFIDGVTVVDRRTGTTLTGTVDLKPTLDRIRDGVPHPHRNDGSIFGNREGLLPNKPNGYYNEYVHPTPGMSDTNPGAQRIIKGQGGEMYYTPDHYGTFIPIN
jgi:filamentous hemagglutinin